jgi:hypothetical protein
MTAGGVGTPMFAARACFFVRVVSLSEALLVGVCSLQTVCSRACLVLILVRLILLDQSSSWQSRSRTHRHDNKRHLGH